METIKRFFRAVGMYAKAVVAIATPFAIEFLIEVAPALQTSDSRGISVVGTALLVYLVPNLKRPARHDVDNAAP